MYALSTARVTYCLVGISLLNVVEFIFSFFFGTLISPMPLLVVETLKKLCVIVVFSSV